MGDYFAPVLAELVNEVWHDAERASVADVFKDRVVADGLMRQFDGVAGFCHIDDESAAVAGLFNVVSDNRNFDARCASDGIFGPYHRHRRA